MYLPPFALAQVFLGGFHCSLNFLPVSSSELDLYARQGNSQEHHINLQDQASVVHPPCPGPFTGRNITKGSCYLLSHYIFCINDCATGLCSYTLILSLKRCFFSNGLKLLLSVLSNWALCISPNSICFLFQSLSECFSIAYRCLLLETNHRMQIMACSHFSPGCTVATADRPVMCYKESL